MVASLIAYAATTLWLAGANYAVAYAATAFAVNFAVSYIVARAFAPNDPSANQPVDQGVRQQVAPNTTNSIPIVYGSAFLGGTFVDAVLTIEQKAMYYVLAISSISPNGQFSFDRTKFYYGDRLITFDSSDPTKVASLTDGAGNVDTKINGYLLINLYTSTDAGVITNVTGTSPSTFMGNASEIAAGQLWTGTRQMNGLAFAIVKLGYSQDAGTTNLQPITFNVTQNLNGTGAAKPGDVWADYVRNEVYGGGMAAALIDSASATALNTYSDQTITFTDSSGNPATQARYRINGVLDTGQNVLANIDRIMLACDSWNAYNATFGKWSIVINKAESASYAFDDTNIIGEIKVSLTDITNSINQIEATFPSKLNRDQRDLVYLETPANLLYANEPINKFSCNFDLINESVQVNYLANRVLEQAREDLIVSINAAYPAIQIDAGDVVSITNTSYGWSAKLFRVMKVSEVSLPDGNLGASLELSEYNAAVYDDVAITQYSPAPNSNLSSASFFSALSAPVVSASRPTNNVPSFDIQITTPSIGRTTRLTLFYSTYSSPTASQWTLLDTFVSAASTPLTPNTTFTFLNLILPAGTYYFGFIAGNDISQSQISGTSSGLVWAPTGTVGTQTAIVYLYQWANSTPGNPSGNSTWTWATASNASYTGGNGWTVAIPANPGTASTYLWQASISISAPASTATTTVSWASGFSVQAIAQNGATGSQGATGNTGNSAVICYAIYAGNPTVTGSAVTISGTGLPNTTSFSPTSATAFTYAVQTPGAAQAMFQSDGIYYPVANQTIWNTPYLSNLKVGNLSAISADLGTITAGSISSNTYTMTSTNGFVMRLGQSSSAVPIALQITGITVNDWAIHTYGSMLIGDIFSGNIRSGYIYSSNSDAAYTGIFMNALCNNVGIYGRGNASYGGASHAILGQCFGGATGNLNTSGIVGTTINYDFYADGAGVNYGPFTGAHDALIPINATITEGDIVVDCGVAARKNFSNTICFVETSSNPNQKGVVGMLVGTSRLLDVEFLPTALKDDPTITVETVIEMGIETEREIVTVNPKPEVESLKLTHKVIAMNALGEGQINVCGEGGNLQIGDMIVTSSIPGKGMKQADDIVRNITVAKSRENVTFISSNEVKQVACIYLCG